jgi:hypothetical protein
MPLTPEEEKELASLESEYARLSGLLNAKEEYVPTGGEFQTPEYGTEAYKGYKQAELKMTGKVPSLVAEYGPPIAAGIATRGRSALQQAMMPALAAVLGKGFARKLEGKEVTSPEALREELAAGIESAVPPTKGTLAGLRYALGAGAAGLTGAGVRGDINKETVLRDVGVYGGIPTLGGLFFGGTKSAIEGAKSQAIRGQQAAQDIERIGPGVVPTFGQALPEYAGLEARISSKAGGRYLTEAMERQNQAIADAVEAIAGGPRSETQGMISNALEAMGVRERTDLLAAADQVSKAREALKLVQGGAREQVVRDTLSKAEKDLEDAITTGFMGRYVMKGGRPEYSGVFEKIKAGKGIESATMQAKKAFSDQADVLFSDPNIDTAKAGFNILAPAGRSGTSVGDEVAKAFSDSPITAGGQIIKEFTPYFGKLMGVLESRSPASLAELRSIREDLYNAAETQGAAFGTKAQAALKSIASKITDTINDQAASVMSPAGANALFKANKFYSEFRPKFENYGVESAFMVRGAKPGTTASRMAGEVAEEGLEAPSYTNLIDLFEGLKKQGVAGVPDTAPIRDALREGLLNQVITRPGNQVVVNFQKLAELAGQVESQSPGALKQLGLGSMDDLNTLIRFKAFRDAEPGIDTIVQAINSRTPIGNAIGVRALQDLKDVADIKSVVNALERKAIGTGGQAGSKEAAEALVQARANAINELLIKTDELGKSPRLAALKDVLDPNEMRRFREIVGPKTMNFIENQMIPGFRRIKLAEEAAGQAGSTVRGAAEEQAIGSITKAPVIAATGGSLGPLRAAGNLIYDLYSLKKYDLLSKVLSRSGGATGFRNRAAQLSRLQQLTEGQPATQVIRMLNDYAEGKPLQ